MMEQDETRRRTMFNKDLEKLKNRQANMEKLTGKGKHTVKLENHSHTNISKPAIVRKGEHKCRILEIHLKLKDQQLKTILFIYRLLYQNLIVTTNRKSTINTHTKKKKESKHNTKVSHQITREENERGREGSLQQYKTNSRNKKNLT